MDEAPSTETAAPTAASPVPPDLKTEPTTSPSDPQSAVAPSQLSTPASRPVITPIVYDLPAAKTAAANVSALLEQTQAKFAARAARFGTPTVRRVSDVQVLGARRAALRTGFATGFDPAAPEHAALRAKRAARFGIVQVKEKENKLDKEEDVPVPESDLLERRRDVAVGEAIRGNVMHVFGVDDLSTPDVMNHFREYGPTWCEWLNDSSCNVVFEDAFTLARALRGMSTTTEEVPEEPTEKMDDGEGAGMGVAVAGEGQLKDELKWKPAVSVRKRDRITSLWIRMATERDVRPEKPNPRSKWSRSVNKEDDHDGGRRSSRKEEADDEGRRTSRQGASLGVRKTRDAIAKVRAKKMSRADLDKALSS